ncbi:MAG: hypothetical protein FJ246_01945 [Nitrospira sp.]|nr:hypothetical protein [Nitrospira sp.]
MALSQEVYDEGQKIASATEATLPGILNGILDRYLGWPLKIRSGYLVDRENSRSDIFASVIYATQAGTTPEPQSIHTDNAAVVIDTYETLDSDKFRDSYARIAKAKRLKKTPMPNLSGVPVQTTTLGVIFALRSTAPLDYIAEELARLNTSTPSQEWPDMVVVAMAGTVNYAVQFPGESLSGDLLPPAPRARDAYIPPMYIIIVVRPTGGYTFNRLVGFLIGQLFLFSPGAKLPDTRQVVEGVPNQGITFSGFQFNLNGDLVPVPRQFYNDRYLPPLPVHIEDGRGDLLCTLQFLPWQDGGTILLRGKLPLDGIMPFLTGVDMRRAGKIKRDEYEIAYVLPITEEDFKAMLVRIGQRSNMVVRLPQPKGTIQKVSDEGTQTPFIARLFLGVLKLRDVIVSDPADRNKFDALYETVLSPLMTARKSTQRIAELWQEHSRKVTSGEVARLQGQMIHVEESIHDELRKEVEGFVIAAGRTIKEGMRKFAAEARVDIGFLFQKQTAFAAGLAALERTDYALAAYLQQTRTWSERLQECRNVIEHKGWILPRVTYSREADTIKAIQPSISGQPVTEFVSFVFDRVACFVEELSAYCVQRQMPAGITIAELPLAERPEEAPERFRVTPASGGLPPWQIVYHQASFERA